MTDPRVKSIVKKFSTIEMFGLVDQGAKADRLKGWTSWQTTCLPESPIMQAWGCQLRQVHISGATAPNCSRVTSS